MLLMFSTWEFSTCLHQWLTKETWFELKAMPNGGVQLGSMTYTAHYRLHHSTNKSQRILILNASLCKVFNFAFVLSAKQRQTPCAIHICMAIVTPDKGNGYHCTMQTINFGLENWNFSTKCAGKSHCAVNRFHATLVGGWRLGDVRDNSSKNDYISGQMYSHKIILKRENAKTAIQCNIFRHGRWQAIGIERFNKMLCKYKLSRCRSQRNHTALALASSNNKIALHLSISLRLPLFRHHPAFPFAHFSAISSIFPSAQHSFLCGGKCQMHIRS